jgi:RimJ/RimL family protein N-acetyltransferase
MNYDIYLRPLNIEDARTSYKWRNNPLIWEYTPFKPTEYITEAIETEWLKKALNVKSDYRFAICLKKGGKYLGNVQLINVKHRSACFHIFIGEPVFWGKGIGKEATFLVLDYGFNELGLRCIMLDVHKEHQSARRVYEKAGFQTFNKKGDFVGMAITKKHYDELKELTNYSEKNNDRNILEKPIFR